MDDLGNEVVLIPEILFKGKRSIDWNNVKVYMTQYIGHYAIIKETNDIIYIAKDFPDEYTGSVYTRRLMGAAAKAKANASQGILELISISKGEHFKENIEDKHLWDARYGWYRYDSRFALPVYADDNSIERYNIYHASMLVRHGSDDKKYLYDILDIKKETSNLLES